MKWNLSQLQKAMNTKGAPLPPLVLLYGEDGGTAREYARHVACLVVSDLDDPFLSDRLSVEDIQSEPSRLRESAETVSLGASVRLIRLEGVNASIGGPALTKVAEAVKQCLSPPVENAVVVISAPGVGKESALVKAVEKDKQAVAIRCFQESLRDLNGYIRKYFNEQGKRVEADAMAFLCDNLGNDRDITNNELEKLSLYVGENQNVTLEDCLNSISSAPSVSVFKLCDAIGARDAGAADTLLHMLIHEGEDLTSAAMLVNRHLRRLLQAKEAMESGMNAQAAMQTLRPPVLFGKAEFAAQLNKYPTARLRGLAERMYQLQRQSRNSTLPPDLVLERALIGFSL